MRAAMALVMEFIFVLSTLLFLQHQVEGGTVPIPDPEIDQIGTDYLSTFGYAGLNNPNEKMASLTDPSVMRTALLNFQDMAGIPKTGVYDAKTKEMMGLPRCGVRDIQNMGDDADARRKKRYALQGSKWRNMGVTYRITSYTRDMNQAQVNEELRRAFKVWSDETGLTFTQRFSGTPDIEIYFTVGDHGDGSAFDGRGGTLAHAFFPEFGGDTHFDDAEFYTFNTSRSGTVNLFQVAAHEFGHSLGLGHSKVNTALMAPFYRGYQAQFKLDKDDIDGIQKIYGKPVRPNPNTPPPTPEPTAPAQTDAPMPTRGVVPRKCDIGNIDAMVNLESNDRAYIFSGEYYWRINTRGVDDGYPKMITRYWGGIPGNLDAAFNLVDRSSMIYFFKGSQYWRFTAGRREQGYPKTIGVHGFFGLRNRRIDAAFVWSGNGRIYIISDNKYYRLGRQTYSSPLPEQAGVDGGYPRDLYLWKGLPRRVGAALQYRNGRTYFFNQDSLEYNRFNDREFRVDTGYPRSTTRWWLGCQTGGLSQPPMEEDTGADIKAVPMQNSDLELERNGTLPTAGLQTLPPDIYDNGSVQLLAKVFTIVLPFITTVFLS